MPVVTRSLVRSFGKAATSPQAPPSLKKRKANSTAILDSNKRPRHNGTSEKEPPPTNNTDVEPSSASITMNSLVPAVLSFDFELAKNHLVSVDRRFQDLFLKMQCKPFEHLEQLDPFRCHRLPIQDTLNPNFSVLYNSALSTSILWVIDGSLSRQ